LRFRLRSVEAGQASGYLFANWIALEPDPMSEFDDRKRAQEKKFELDQDLEFKAMNRRNKLLGLWAAGLLGKSGDAADAYAKEVVMVDYEEAGEDDVFRKVRKDFDAAGVTQTDHQIRQHMADLMDTARAQIRDGK
jgi:hypothetical protein